MYFSRLFIHSSCLRAGIVTRLCKCCDLTLSYPFDTTCIKLGNFPSLFSARKRLAGAATSLSSVSSAGWGFQMLWGRTWLFVGVIWWLPVRGAEADVLSRGVWGTEGLLGLGVGSGSGIDVATQEGANRKPIVTVSVSSSPHPSLPTRLPPLSLDLPPAFHLFGDFRRSLWARMICQSMLRTESSRLISKSR